MNVRPDGFISSGGHPIRRKCRLCGSGLVHNFVDLGMSPLCESFLSDEQLDSMEPYLPLHALVCGECFLVQLKEYSGRNTSLRITPTSPHTRLVLLSQLTESVGRI
jgi:hypothetical protein